MKIRIKEIRQKAAKARLPGKIDKEYPPKIPAIFLSKATRDALIHFSKTDLHNELGGVLIGQIKKASRRMFVEVHNFIPASKGISRRASFEFTNEAQQEIHETLHSQFPEMKILGWFHTHPGYGIFLSSADQFIDEHYFNEPYHVAMVLDPTREEVEMGFFVWDLERNRIRVPFFELS